MFEGIKSRFGISREDESYGEHGYDPRYEQDYDDYDDYDGYDDYGYYSDADADADRFESRANVTTRPSGVSLPNLVTAEDVRAHRQSSDASREPLSRRQTGTSAGLRRGNRVTVDADGDEPVETASARTSTARERSESLDSLFSSTADAASRSQAAAGTSAAGRSSFDPYEAYASGGAGKHEPTRSLTVLKPMSYGEVERIAKSLKAGDAVVLGLRNTPDSLSKRILDFSFGVASALDASVDCVADKVFVVARGAALTESEKASLRNQGVL